MCLRQQIPLMEQKDCFQPPPSAICHVVLATNIAESSLTLPAVDVVIDTCRKREMVYDRTLRIEQLRELQCARASMDQRKGESVC